MKLLACGFLTLTTAAGALRADDVGPGATPVGDQIRETPGVLEFSGRLLVRPRAIGELIARGLSAEEAAQQDRRARDRLAATLVEHVDQTDEFIVSVPNGLTDASYTVQLVGTGDYQYAHPDWICYPAGTPNDPALVSQYFHSRLQSTLAWDVTTGSASVVCAVCDTGVDLLHPDLSARLVSGFNSADGLAQAQGGAVTDINGHGTLVAGCVSGTGNNGLGGSGMGWGLSIMPVRVTNLSNGAAPLSQITAGARWAADHGAKAINVSFSGVANGAVQTAGAYCRGAGALLCWAAGNSGTVLSLGADWPDVMIVGSVDATDTKAGTSNFGTPIDCVAPGVDIYGPALGGGYGSSSGTSFATPLVVGTLGLIFSANPGLSAIDAQNILFQGCEDLGSPGEDLFYGPGRINAYRSVWIATHGVDSPIPGPDSAETSQNVAITIDVLANDADALGRTLTIVGFDASSSLGGTVSRSVGTGAGGEDELAFTPGTPGTDSFEYTLSNGVELSTVVVTVGVIDAAALQTSEAVAGAAPGLNASIYDLQALVPLQLPVFSTLTPALTTSWSQVNFAPTLIEFPGTLFQDDLGAVATGYLTVPSDGFYRFELESDDGSRLYLGSTLVVDNDGLHAMHTESAEIGLRAGGHPLRIEFFERTGTCGLLARIAGPGIPLQIIPASMLSHSTGSTLDVNQDGDINPDDLGDFITFYFSDDLRADFDGNGILNPDDLGDYITAYFTR